MARLTGPRRLTAFEASPSATLSAHAPSKAVNPRALQALAPAEEYGVRGWGTWGVAVAAAAVVFCAQGTRAHHAACQQRQAAKFQGVWLTSTTKVAYVSHRRSQNTHSHGGAHVQVDAVRRARRGARRQVLIEQARSAACGQCDQVQQHKRAAWACALLSACIRLGSAGVLELAAARRRADTGRSAPVLRIMEASGNGDPVAGEPGHMDKHIKIPGCHMMGTQCSSACWQRAVTLRTL